MAQVIGQRTTGQAVNETRLIRRVDDQIGYLEPSEAPLITFLQRMRKRLSVDSPRIEWYEDDYNARWAVVGGTAAANSTTAVTVTVTDGTAFVVGDLFVVPKASASSGTPELCRVISIAGNVLSVVRDLGSVGADTIPANGALRLAGNAYEEGGAIATAKTTAPILRTGFLQIFRETVDTTKTYAASRQYGAPEGERKRQQMKTLKQHKINLNSAFLWGQATENLAGPNGKPLRTTAGLNTVIQTNVFDCGGSLTQKFLEQFSRASFRYGNNIKMLLCAPIYKSALNEFAKSFLLVKPGETKFGVKIQQVETAHGTWMVVNDWMLESAISSANGFGGWAFSIDMDQISYRYLSYAGINRDTHITENIVQAGYDSFQDEVLSECGLAIKQEKYHAKMYNCLDYAT